ncbi:MAG: hypothetical protein Q9227_002215 [Pyrenula ochraceoflavens]
MTTFPGSFAFISDPLTVSKPAEITLKHARTGLANLRYETDKAGKIFDYDFLVETRILYRLVVIASRDPDKRGRILLEVTRFEPKRPFQRQGKAAAKPLTPFENLRHGTAEKILKVSFPDGSPQKISMDRWTSTIRMDLKDPESPETKTTTALKLNTLDRYSGPISNRIKAINTDNFAFTMQADASSTASTSNEIVLHSRVLGEIRYTNCSPGLKELMDKVEEGASDDEEVEKAALVGDGKGRGVKSKGNKGKGKSRRQRQRGQATGPLEDESAEQTANIDISEFMEVAEGRQEASEAIKAKSDMVEFDILDIVGEKVEHGVFFYKVKWAGKNKKGKPWSDSFVRGSDVNAPEIVRNYETRRQKAIDAEEENRRQQQRR